jgi:PAS domain S-box-containing protein
MGWKNLQREVDNRLPGRHNLASRARRGAATWAWSRWVPHARRVADVSAVKHRKRKLRAQAALLKPLLDVSPSAIVITDHGSIVIAWNPAAEELFGYTAEEAIGRNLDDLVAATEELHEDAVAYSERIIGDERIRTVARRTRKDGSLVDVEVRAAPMLVGGETIGTFGTYHDITEVTRQKRFYEALLDVSPAAIVAIDPKDRVTLWNPAAERLFGYTTGEAVGRNVDDLVANHPDIRGEGERLNRTALGGQVRVVTRRVRKDGSLVEVEVLGAPVMVGGELVGRYAIYLDISELERQRQYYEALLEFSPTAIIAVDPSATVTSWNPSAERLFGYSAQEAIGRNVDDMVANRPDIRDEAVDLSRRITESQVRLTTRRTRKDGSLVDVDITGAPIRLGGELVGAYGLFHDITDLQRERRYYEALVELSPTAIVATDPQAVVTSWNPAAEQLFGYTAEEAVGRPLDDMVANREDLHAEGAGYTEAALRGERVRAFARRTRKDGSLADVELISEPIIVAEEPLGFLAMYHDVTELQQQTRYYQSIVDLSPTAIVTVDETNLVTRWNPAAEDLFGYTSEEAVGRDLDSLVGLVDAIRGEAEAYTEAMARGEQVRAITRRTRKDASLVDVEMLGTPVYVGGERVGHSVIYHDISELQRQKRYYESLLETSPSAIMTVDRDAIVTSWNPAAERLLGYSRDEAVGRRVDDLVANRDDLREEAERVTRQAALGGQVHVVTRRTRKDGSLVDVDVVAAPIFIGGEQVGYFAMYSDVSELQRQKRYLEALFDSSPVAIALLDLEGKVTSWNPTAERLFGYPAEEAVGRNIDDLVAATEDVRDEALALTREGMRGEFQHRVVTRRTRKDGSFVDVEMFGARVNVGGETVGLYGMYHDIGALLQAQREAEAATRAKSAFLATMSHEIRTPLNAVIGMTGLLLDTELSPEQRGFGEVIRSSGDALLDVINEILDFSKIEAGRLDLEHRPFHLRQCVESALELVASSAADKSLDLAYLIDPRTPASIVGDVTRLRQILLNLLNNAVKFTSQGEVVLRVDATRVRSAPDGSHRYEVHFAVRDTGIGIPENRMDRLFEAFTQVDASITRRYGGTGLGLAISARLAEEMGGRLWAESRVGEGSTFHVTIVADAAAGPMAADELQAVPELGGKRVLIVDDNATNREILRRQAESWAMVPQEAASPGEALEYVRRGDRFDVAILDMQMPEMDGVTLAHEIRRNRNADDLPLVMLTSLGREATPSDAVFAAHLTKPIRPSHLYDTLIGIFAPQVSPQRVGRPEPPAAPPPADRPHLRILLAEDNPVNQRVALLLLEKLGYRADVASDGREALQALERQRYDVVLMDVQMPEMDGLEATRRILERWADGDRPRIVAMTAGATEADREACLAAGMDDYVSKPIREHELSAALERSIPTVPHPTARGPVTTFDPEALDRLRTTVGGDEALREVTATFFEDTDRTLDVLRAEVEAGRASEVRRRAHSLKSTAASFGATRLAELSRSLEHLGFTGSLDGAGELVEGIAAEFARVRERLAERTDP